MTSNCVVVVWEAECLLLNKYIPYSPNVSQHLERAHAKKLTQVFLGDSDASLNEYYVNLRTMKQCSESSDTEHPLVNVRRQFYNPCSPPGKGIRWEYAGNSNSDWHQYDIEHQCLIEDAWSKGNPQIDLSSSYIHMPYIIDFCNMTQTRKPSGPIRQIRRVSQVPYPLTKLQSAMNPQQSSAVLNTNKLSNIGQGSVNSSLRLATNTSRRNFNSNYFQHQHTRSSSVPKLNTMTDASSQSGSIKSAPASNPHPVAPANLPPSGKKKLPKPTKQHSNEHSTAASTTTTTSPTNLARQILHNLNIFSHHHHHHHDKGETSGSHKKGFILSHGNSLKTSKKALCKSTHGSTSMLDSIDTSSINSRRPSVDTISTYLSNGSKGSVRGKPSYGSVSDLLNCSLSSENDEVFLSSHSSLSSSMSMNMIIKGSIVGIDSSSDQISKFVCVVDPPQSKPCPICLNELHRDNSAKNPTVSLTRCQHLMHLNCLNELILSQKNDLQKVGAMLQQSRDLQTN